MVEYEYAKALFSLAPTDKKAEKFIEYFNVLNEAIKENPDFIKIMDSPTIDKKSKKNIITKVCKKFDDLFVDFLYTLIDNNRFKMLSTIYSQYQQIFNEHNDILNIEVLSDREVSPKQLEQIKNGYVKRYPFKKIIIKNIIDSTISGGIHVLCNGESIDASVKNMVTKMKESL